MADGQLADYPHPTSILPGDLLYLVRGDTDYAIPVEILLGSGLPFALDLRKPLAAGGAVQLITNGGIIVATTTLTKLTTDTPSVFTIADGTVNGQLEVIKLVETGGDAVLDTKIDVASITWTNVGDSALLLWDSSQHLWLWVAGSATIVHP